MKEALFILGVIALILAYTAFRHRKTIAAVFRVFKMLRSPDNIPYGTGSIGGTSASAKGGKLVQCAGCGVRIPEDRAIQGINGASLCSRECAGVRASRQ